MICKVCKEDKSPDKFIPNKITKSGYDGSCRSCRLEHNRLRKAYPSEEKIDPRAILLFEERYVHAMNHLPASLDRCEAARLAREYATKGEIYDQLKDYMMSALDGKSK